MSTVVVADRQAHVTRLTRSVRSWLPAAIVFATGIVSWQWLLPDVAGIESFLLPRFSDVMDALWTERDALRTGAWITFKEALFGLLLGSVTGIAGGLALARWRALGGALMPYFIAANAVPVIAFAPVTNAWFGTLSPWSKIVIAAVLCFFPVLVNTLRGLQSVQPEQIELMQSYAAGGFETFRRVRFPTALPYIFTSLKVASVLAMIGAVVGEYFGGSFNALGVLIRSRAQILDFDSAWAAIVVACVFGIGFYAAVAVAERLVVRWAPAARDS